MSGAELKPEDRKPDAREREEIRPEDLRWDENGLIPAIVQDAVSKEVLTLAYMNRESLARSLATGETWFWSRSRRELWHKGATSGNTQKIRSIRCDCDRDALLVTVVPAGPACHTGSYSCFSGVLRDAEGAGASARAAGEAAAEGSAGGAAGGAGTGAGNGAGIGTGAGEGAGEGAAGSAGAAANGDRFAILNRLERVIAEREAERPEGSYTTYLFEKGVDKILKKVGEEAAEVIIAAKNRSHDELRWEVSDLIYHLLVLLREQKLPLDDVLAELEKRHR